MLGSHSDEDIGRLSVILLKQMTYNIPKVTGIVISLLLALSIVIVIIIKTVVPDSDNGLEFSLFGDIFG